MQKHSKLLLSDSKRYCKQSTGSRKMSRLGSPAAAVQLLSTRTDLFFFILPLKNKVHILFWGVISEKI